MLHKQTPLMLTFLDDQLEKMNGEIERSRRERRPQGEREAARVAIAMMEFEIEKALILQNSMEQETAIQEKITAGGIDTNISPITTWIEPARPIEFNSKVQASAFFLSCSGSSETINQVKESIPEKLYPMAERLEIYEHRWMLDIIDASGTIIAACVYHADRPEGQRWQSSEEVELCPWGKCHQPGAQFLECAACARLRTSIVKYICSALAEHQATNLGLPAPQEEEAATTGLHLIERYRANRNADIERGIRLYQLDGDEKSIQMARILKHLFNEILDKSHYIYLEKSSEQKINQKMKEIATGKIFAPQEFYKDPTKIIAEPLWIACETPLAIKDVPILIQGLHFSKPNDPIIIAELRKTQEVPESLGKPGEGLWGVDLINNRGTVAFNFVWTGERWGINALHRCPFRSCTPAGIQRGHACATCQIVYKWAAMWLGTILLARSGFFQEIRLERRDHRPARAAEAPTPPIPLEEPTQEQAQEAAQESETRSSPTSTTDEDKAEPPEKTEAATTEPHYTIKNINITTRVEYVEEEAGEEEDDNHGTGIHWVSLHKPEEIEEITHKPAAHERKLRRGDQIVKIQVKQGKERRYWRLSASKQKKTVEKLTADSNERGEQPEE